MINLTCIVCPIGCALDVEKDSDNVSVSGNKCPRGKDYAMEEISCPKRVVTATAPLIHDHINDKHGVRRIPVRTTSPCPREKIPALLKDIYNTKVSIPVKAGDVIINNWMNENIDIIATRTIS